MKTFYMRRMFPMVWSSRSMMKEAALTILVSLSYETLKLNKKRFEFFFFCKKGKIMKKGGFGLKSFVLFRSLGDDEALVAVRGVHGCSLRKRVSMDASREK